MTLNKYSEGDAFVYTVHSFEFHRHLENSAANISKDRTADLQGLGADVAGEYETRHFLTVGLTLGDSATHSASLHLSSSRIKVVRTILSTQKGA